MKHHASLLPFLAACGTSGGDLRVEPAFLDFGEVDFQDALPEGGYGRREVALTNEGSAPVQVTIPGFDGERLCVTGLDPAEAPLALPAIEPGSRYLLYVGVCGYLPGERDTRVDGSIMLVNDGVDPVVTVDYAFTPTRDIGSDDTA